MRIVTKKATMRLGENQLRGPVSFAEGKIIGISPGTALVEAEFDGVASKGGLQVTVTDKLDIDEIRIAPEVVNILPGETVGLEAIGYKSGRSVGRITGMAGVQWSASNAQVAQLSGSSVRVNCGEAAVTAHRARSPARPRSAWSFDCRRVGRHQDSIEMVVGESRRIGVDPSVFRGEVDFSRGRVTSALPGVVRYDPLTHSLVGVSPGVSAVTFAWGDKLATTSVRVLPAGAVDGRIVVEPASGVLSPGQALDLRVYVLTGDGRRIDRTASCVLSSSAPQTVSIVGNLAAPERRGGGEITAHCPSPQRRARSRHGQQRANHAGCAEPGAACCVGRRSRNSASSLRSARNCFSSTDLAFGDWARSASCPIVGRAGCRQSRPRGRRGGQLPRSAGGEKLVTVTDRPDRPVLIRSVRCDSPRTRSGLPGQRRARSAASSPRTMV